MVLCNSLYVLPRYSEGVGIVVFDNPQAQELFRLNGLKFNTTQSIRQLLRKEGFVYIPKLEKWLLKTQDNTYPIVLRYAQMFSTTYHENELQHYWSCPSCGAAVPDTWKKCAICK